MQLSIPPRPDLASDPTPPRPWTSVRPPYIGVAVGLVWLLSALIAHERIGYYPPRTSKPVLMMLAAAVGIVGWIVASMAQERARARTTGGALVAAAIVPFMLTAWVPGIARLKTYAIPGSPTMVIAAAPEGNWDLWLIHGDKPDSYTRLTHTPEPERGPSLSPDGRRIVYSSPVGEHDALWIMSLDGNGNPAGTKLLPDSGSDAEEATWSPDGSTILFTQGGPGGSNIHALDIATMRNTALTTDGGALNPAWAPDGSSIAYTKALSNASAIWLMNADGTDRRAAFGGGGYPYAPEWSPDGTKILFTLVGAGTETDVFVANVDGTQVRDLTPGTSSHDVSKGWTPDGQPLFLSNRSNTGGTFLYVMHPDGSDVRLCVIL